MIEVNIIYCKNCGEPLNLSDEKNNIIKCKYCSTEHILPKDYTSEEAKLYLHDGQRSLDVGNFDEALICFDKALEIEPFEPEGYFGRFLAKHKVQYLKDVVNNRLQPIVHDLINKDILDDSDYKKACKAANNDQKEIYQKRAEEIAHIKKSFMELEKSKLDYDCFICVKVTDDETKGRTKDSRTAEKIYDVLKRKGYKPFYSEIEIKGRTGSDYEAMILYALMKSECMLVVCSNEEYLNTKWVKNEYTRFLKLVNDEVKASDAITIVFDGKPIEKLPGKKGKIQGINISSLDAMETIEKYVYNHTPKAKSEREAKEKAKLKEGEELKRQLAEQAEIIRKLQEQQNNSKQNSSVDLSSINILELIEKAQREKEERERLEKEKSQPSNVSDELITKALNLYGGHHYEEAFPLLLKCKDSGNVRVQYALGYCYSQGKGVSQDYNQAYYWYEKAANQGDIYAQANIGYYYEKGFGVSQDYKQAAYWYEKAANQEHSIAQSNLGLLYYNGRGVSQDYNQAFYWFEKSSKQGNANAQCWLGYCYEKGYGTSIDYNQAFYWYEKAANQSHSTAQCNLGILYNNDNGVSQDYKQAFYWYEKAASQGEAAA